MSEQKSGTQKSINLHNEAALLVTDIYKIGLFTLQKQ